MKYYAGYLKSHEGIIFRSETEPTEQRHPLNVQFAWGPYSNMKRAIQAAMFQNYAIVNPDRKHSLLWNGQHQADLFPAVN